jgi:hypothetical protein
LYNADLAGDMLINMRAGFPDLVSFCVVDRVNTRSSPYCDKASRLKITDSRLTDIGTVVMLAASHQVGVLSDEHLKLGFERAWHCLCYERTVAVSSGHEGIHYDNARRWAVCSEAWLCVREPLSTIVLVYCTGESLLRGPMLLGNLLTVITRMTALALPSFSAVEHW